MTSHVYTGLEAIRWERSICEPFNGRRINDAFLKEAEAVLPERFIAHDEIHRVLSKFEEMDFFGTVYLPDGTVTTGKTVTLKRTEDVLGDMEYIYQYGGAWKRVIGGMPLVGGVAVAVGVFIASLIFSDEYATGTDALLLTSKHGKRRLGRRKALFGMLFPPLLAFVSVILYVLVIFSAFGFSDGSGNAALFVNVGISNSDSVLNGFYQKDVGVTFFGAAARSLLTILVMAMICSAVALLISSISKTSILSLGITGAILLMPDIVLSAINNDRLFSNPILEKLGAYLPMTAISQADTNWIVMQFPTGESYLPYLFVLCPIMLIAVCAVYFLSSGRFAKHQVV